MPLNEYEITSRMDYCRLGKTNLIISETVLGWHFNNPSGQHFWAKFTNDELPADVAKNQTEVVSRGIDNWKSIYRSVAANEVRLFAKW